MGNTSQTKDNLIAAMRDLIWVGSYAGTSVDGICARAKVHKGSFYHYFRSKADLAVAAVEDCWEGHRAEMDGVFSPTKAGLNRILDWLVYLVEEQRAMREIHGRVLGCPIHTIGVELGGSESALQELLKRSLREYLCYLESALRDAHAASEVEAPDAGASARLVFFYVEGLLTHARIWNDLGQLDQMARGVEQLLGNPAAWPSEAADATNPPISISS